MEVHAPKRSSAPPTLKDAAWLQRPETALTFAARPAPHPAGPMGTTLEYVLGSDATGRGPVPVSFSVHDVLGRRVRTLVDEVQGAGRYRLRWDGTDQRGVRVPPGIYSARLRAGHTARSVKVVVVH